MHRQEKAERKLQRREEKARQAREGGDAEPAVPASDDLTGEPRPVPPDLDPA